MSINLFAILQESELRNIFKFCYPKSIIELLSLLCTFENESAFYKMYKTSLYLPWCAVAKWSGIRGKFTAMIFIDLKKALATVDH